MNPDDDNVRAHEEIDDTAAAWLCERTEGFTAEREREFAAWRDEDVRHAAAVERVERALALLDEMQAVRAPIEARFGATDAIGTTTVARRRFSLPAWISGLAAMLVVGALAWWLAAGPLSGEEHYRADGEQRRVTLRDSSVVDLNAGSELRVRFSAARRDVTLHVGEAHFQVAHDPERPFVVSAGGVAVRAIGTAFNVRLAASAVDVLVVEGKVEVARVQPPVAAPAAEDTPAARPQVVAGERAIVSRETAVSVPQVERAAPENIRATLAWQNPVTTFTDVPLRDVVSQFNRRNVRQLVLDDAALGERRIGGVIALDQVEAFVRLLEQDGDVTAEWRGEREIVLRRAPAGAATPVEKR